MFLLISILFLFVSLAHTQSSLPSGEEINKMVFSQEKAFFLTQSKRFFGFIDAQNQYYMMVQQVKSEQKVLRLDAENGYFLLRRERQGAYIFNLEHVNIQEINVQIRFRHQKIIDLMRKGDIYYVMTNKDLRKYDGSQAMKEDVKNIITSCRKKQWFLTFYEFDGLIKIILVKDGEICLRIVKQGQKTAQKCLFNISTEITETSKIKGGILLKADNINYVIEENLNVYSFKGKINQITHKAVTFQQQFKSFYFQSRVFTDGLNVFGSTDKNDFIIQENKNKSFVLLHNGTVVDVLGQERPKRAWISEQKPTIFKLILQFEKNHIVFKTIKIEGKNGDQCDSNHEQQL